MEINDNFEKQYEQLYQEMVGTPEEIEMEIEDISSYVAEKLIVKGNNVQCEFQGDIYNFKMIKGIKNWKETIIIAALRYYDPDKKNNGRIYKVEVELDKKLTETENVAYGVKTLFQHILGIIKPEELEE